MALATIAVPLAFAIVGALIYALSTNAKVVRMAEITFFVGMLWLVFRLSGQDVHF